VTTITITPSVVTVAGHAVSGRQWLVDATLPTETGADATSYLARNAAKTRVVHAFLGVPYARQPVGQWRLRPALKVAPTGPVNASKYGAVAPQGYSQEPFDTGRGRSDLGRARGLSAWGALGTREGEDCLNLNIWTPSLAASGLPVVVQFHGGGSNYLSACDDRLAGHRLCTKGVVVVRVEYRVGTLGHYYLPDTDAVPGLAGTVNLSLTDAFAALTWVQDHIAAFGGNPGNVTIMGGSAGGNMVLCVAANRAFDALWHKSWVSSASAGFDPRPAFRPHEQFESYVDWFADRQVLVTALAPTLPDALDPSRTLADAIGSVGYSEAVRRHMYLDHFHAVDEGGYDVRLSGTVGYAPTRALTLMWDNKTVFRANNRAAAREGDFLAKPMVVGAAENEASVLGNTLAGNAPFFIGQLANVSTGMTAHQWAASPIYSTEWNGAPATPGWGAVNMALPRLPWGPEPEPNRMAFNHAYAHAARCVADAVDGSGARAWLYHWNYRALNKVSTGRAGHTDDEPYLFANPLWDLDPPENGPPEPITTRDLRMADMMSQAVASFAASGDPNAVYPSQWDFSLFGVASGQAFTQFDWAAKNWNVIGQPFRSAVDSPATITNFPNFWDHALSIYDSRLPVGPSARTLLRYAASGAVIVDAIKPVKPLRATRNPGGSVTVSESL